MNTFSRGGNFSSFVTRTTVPPLKIFRGRSLNCISRRSAWPFFGWPFLITSASPRSVRSSDEEACSSDLSVHNSSSGAMEKKDPSSRSDEGKRRMGWVAERGGEGGEARCSLLWHILEKVSDPRRDNGPSRERETV